MAWFAYEFRVPLLLKQSSCNKVFQSKNHFFLKKKSCDFCFTEVDPCKLFFLFYDLSSYFYSISEIFKEFIF